MFHFNLFWVMGWRLAILHSRPPPVDPRERCEDRKHKKPAAAKQGVQWKPAPYSRNEVDKQGQIWSSILWADILQYIYIYLYTCAKHQLVDMAQDFRNVLKLPSSQSEKIWSALVFWDIPRRVNGRHRVNQHTNCRYKGASSSATNMKPVYMLGQRSLGHRTGAVFAIETCQGVMMCPSASTKVCFYFHLLAIDSIQYKFFVHFLDRKSRTPRQEN